MPVTPETTPVEDSVKKINDEFAVGSDLEFQKKWSRFERAVWVLLIIFVLLSLAGVFGRGPLANAEKRASDGSMDIKYERVQRFGTPSVLSIEFPASSIQDGAVHVWASDTLVKPLGTQRVVPQPEKSVIGNGGILYTFPRNICSFIDRVSNRAFLHRHVDVKSPSAREGSSDRQDLCGAITCRHSFTRFSGTSFFCSSFAFWLGVPVRR